MVLWEFAFTRAACIAPLPTFDKSKCAAARRERLHACQNISPPRHQPVVGWCCGRCVPVARTRTAGYPAGHYEPNDTYGYWRNQRKERGMSGRNNDFTPLPSRLQGDIAREILNGNPAVPGIADLLNIRCHQLVNGGRFEDARAGFLENELERNGAFLPMALARVVLEGDAPGFWHWEGDTLVVDVYDAAREKRFQAMREGGKRGMARRWRRQPAMPAAAGLDSPLYNPLCNPLYNNKEINTTFGSISKAVPSAGAAGAGFDDGETGAACDAEEIRKKIRLCMEK